MDSWRAHAMACWADTSGSGLPRATLEQVPMLPRFLVGVGALVASRRRSDRAAVALEVLASLEGGGKPLRWVPMGGADALLGPLLVDHAPEVLAALAVRARSGLGFVVAHARATANGELAAACGKLHRDLYTLNRNAEVEAFLVAAEIARRLPAPDAVRARAHTADAWDATLSGGAIQDGAEEAEATAVFLAGVDEDDDGHVAQALEQLDRFGRDRGAVRGMSFALLRAVRACVRRAGATKPEWLERAVAIAPWIAERPSLTEAWIALWQGAVAVGDDALEARAAQELRGEGRHVRQVVRDESADPEGARCPLVPPTRKERMRDRIDAGDLHGALQLAAGAADLGTIAGWTDVSGLFEVDRAIEGRPPHDRAFARSKVAARAAALGAVEVLLALRSSPEWETRCFVAAGLTALGHPDWQDALADAVTATAQCKVAFV